MKFINIEYYGVVGKGLLSYTSGGNGKMISDFGGQFTVSVKIVSRTIGNNLTIAGVDRQDMVCSYAGTLHGNSEEHMTAIHINMD